MAKKNKGKTQAKADDLVEQLFEAVKRVPDSPPPKSSSASTTVNPDTPELSQETVDHLLLTVRPKDGKNEKAAAKRKSTPSSTGMILSDKDVKQLLKKKRKAVGE